MTKKQATDLETIKFFIPRAMRHIPITKQDEIMFLEWSDEGKHKDKVGGLPYPLDGFNALVEGKSWRGVHMRMYEEGVNDLSMPYLEIVSGMPRPVVDFLKKEMFKGSHAKLIEDACRYAYEMGRPSAYVPA